jgi:multidrug efflux pump subunit AcrB
VVIKIFGDDLDVLDRKAKEISQVVASVRGAASVQVESPPGSPRIVVRLRRDRLRQLGFRPVDVMEAVGTAYEGTPVAQTYQANCLNRPTTSGSCRTRSSRMTETNQDGLRVPLRQLADIFEDSGRSAILHDATRRRQAVTCDVRGRDLVSQYSKPCVGPSGQKTKPTRARGPVQRDSKEVMVELVAKLSERLEQRPAQEKAAEGKPQGVPAPNRDRMTVGVDLGDRVSSIGWHAQWG